MGVMEKQIFRTITVDVAKEWSDIIDELKAGVSTSLQLSKMSQHSHLRDEFLEMDENRAKVKALMLFKLELINSNEHYKMKKEIEETINEFKNRTTEIKED